jgi:hypothetical protein
MLNFDSMITLTTGRASARRVVMIGTIRMAVAAVLDLPADERETARITGEGLPAGGIPVPPFGAVKLPEPGRMTRAATLSSVIATP